MHAGRRHARLVAWGALAALPSTPASAADGAAVSTSLIAFVVALAVAIVGLVALASGLSHLAGGTSGRKPGWLGALNRLGGRSEAEGREARIRRAVTSIILGTALLGVPDMLGMGVISQARIVYAEVQKANAGSGGASTAVTIKERYAGYAESSGGASSDTGKWPGLPWWAMGIVGLILLATLLARATAADGSGATTFTGQAGGAAGSTSGSFGSFEGRAAGGGSAAGGGGGAVRKKKSIWEQIIEAVERIKMKLRKFMAGLKTQARILEEKTEGLRGRLRPVTDFAAARLGEAVKIVADQDDGGSGLPRARDAGDRE